MKTSSKRTYMKRAVVLTLFFILCSVGATLLFFSCENHWIIEATNHMFCDDCGKPNPKCICVDTPDDPAVTLDRIEAHYSQTTAVYTFTLHDSLKDNLTVTAFFDDGTDRTLDAQEYTLTGTLTVGTSTITVTYDGKTTTFNVEVTADPDPTCDHDWIWTVTTAATCATDGVETEICSHDSAHTGGTRPIPALEHDYNWAQTTDSSCTTAGIETGTCSHDPTHTTTRTGAPALGHDYNWAQTTDPSCTTAGIGTETCSHDPTHTRATRLVPALGHDISGDVCTGCGSSVITVPSQDHLTLADAINAAPAGAATIIRLEENIIIPSAIAVNGKEITIVSQSGNTTLLLGAGGSMFTVGLGGNLTLGDNTSNTLTLEGSDNNTTSLITVNSGGTLEMNDSAVITGNVFRGSSANGAGVQVVGGVFNMNGGKITDCTADFNGGAVRIANSGTATISGNSEISGNTSVNVGGAISVSGGSTLTIEGDVTIHNNRAVAGGAIYITGAGTTVNMMGGSIYNNTATGTNGGGGVYVQSNGTFNFYGGIIYGADGLTQTHSPQHAQNTAANGAALNVVGGTALYGDGTAIDTSEFEITIVGRPAP